ncbi:DMT family transporter [Senegalia massiliensis]|uniref:DMT family transporter n=2 Tax=Senegalia massiliensis TaxID=1720316 RepID=A0A845QVL0_9CLOT|nr:DMT family transporter [Senegalia massiliensis]NBI05546.1 DMT family transporter [Senegalia massiliensis]
MALVLVAIIWGSGFVVTKNGLDNMTPLFMNAMRFIIASILMSVVFFKKLKTVNKSDIIAGAIIGSFLFSAFAAQTVGLQFTTASKQAFLTATNVVMVPFLFWFISKRKPHNLEILATFITLVGIGFLTLEGGVALNSGDLLTLLCALLFAAHITSIGHFAKKHDPIVLTILQFIFAAIFSIILAIPFEPINLDISGQGWFTVLYLGGVSTLIAFLIQNIAQKYTTSTHTAIILSLEAVFGTLFSILLLGELFTIKMVIGSAIIFVGIITAETKWEFLRKKSQKINNENI